MNKLSINGRLIKDPKLIVFKNNATLCTFYIANDLFFGSSQKTGFYKCKAWGKAGKVIAEQAKTGTELTIVGRLNQHKYENRDGQTISDVCIIVEQFSFGSKLLRKSVNDLQAAS